MCVILTGGRRLSGTRLRLRLSGVLGDGCHGGAALGRLGLGLGAPNRAALHVSFHGSHVKEETAYLDDFVDLEVLQRRIEGHPEEEEQQLWAEGGERMTRLRPQADDSNIRRSSVQEESIWVHTPVKTHYFPPWHNPMRQKAGPKGGRSPGRLPFARHFGWNPPVFGPDASFL